MGRELLLKMLNKFGCPPKFVGVFKSFHDGMNASVSAAGEASDLIGVLTGMQQVFTFQPVCLRSGSCGSCWLRTRKWDSIKQ